MKRIHEEDDSEDEPEVLAAQAEAKCRAIPGATACYSTPASQPSGNSVQTMSTEIPAGGNAEDTAHQARPQQGQQHDNKQQSEASALLWRINDWFTVYTQQEIDQKSLSAQTEAGCRALPGSHTRSTTAASRPSGDSVPSARTGSGLRGSDGATQAAAPRSAPPAPHRPGPATQTI